MSEEIAKTKVYCPCRVIEAQVQELGALLKSFEVSDIGVHDEIVNKQLVNFSEKVLCVEQEVQNVKQEHEGLSRSIFKEIESMQRDLINVLLIQIIVWINEGFCVCWDSVKISIAIQETIYNRFWSRDIAYEIQTDLCELVQGDMDVESLIAKFFEELCLNSGSNDLNEVLVVRLLNGLNSCYKDDVSLIKENDLYRTFQRVVLLELCAIDWIDSFIVAIDGGSYINCISKEFVRVNHLEVKDLSEPYKLRWLHGGMELSATQSAKKLGMVFVGSLNVFSYRDHENRLVELRSLSPWESEHIMFERRELARPLYKVKDVQQNKKEGKDLVAQDCFLFKNRRKFVVRTWPSLKKYSPTPSSGNNEVEEESLIQQQVSVESSDDFPNKWSDSSDVQEIDPSEFVPKSKRLEEIEDAHSSV
ncbi:OLC1v1018581C1 [Oldenlandia corymbosa var. corymbosa]|uniref:OLC1v1018581C1 n=1 Tax=Oldenlandia corymbosa var. corymbosa TaxID=529605 RepID=A0AAV1EBY1_OLDCO|nr:OLC1v1018581C1 [Oldenlandia corymbosa var. corymbosa]